MAAQSDDIVKVKKLLKKGIDPNVRNPESGVTPLGVAAERGYIEVMKALLAAKALVNVTTIDALTPLHISCQLGKVDAARLLIDAHAEVNMLSAKHVPCGTTPLVAATIRNSLPVVRMLIEAHADVNLSQEGSSGNALHLACQMGHPNVLKELLATGQANVTLRNGHGEMAIEVAMTQGTSPGHLECMDLLLPLNDKANAIAFESASKEELEEMVINMKMRILEMQKNEGAPPAVAVDLILALLRSAARSGDLQSLKHTMASGVIDEHTIDRPDSEGRSALHFACAAGHLGVAACLIGKKANVNAVDKKGGTPLRMARAGEHTLLVQMLLKHGATSE